MVPGLGVTDVWHFACLMLYLTFSDFLWPWVCLWALNPLTHEVALTVLKRHFLLAAVLSCFSPDGSELIQGCESATYHASLRSVFGFSENIIKPSELLPGKIGHDSVTE